MDAFFSFVFLLKVNLLHLSGCILFTKSIRILPTDYHSKVLLLSESPLYIFSGSMGFGTLACASVIFIYLASVSDGK